MKAAYIREYGSADVLKVGELPDPVPKRGQVLVEVHATSVNPVDWKLRSGAFRVFVRFKMPRVLGLDLSGVVRAVGPGVTRFAPGDEVFGSPSHWGQGTYAELCAASAKHLAKKPKNLSHTEAASLPLTVLTAWQALVVLGKVKAGDRVLIQAGAGGVGSLAIQIAKHFGAEVITTASERNFELVKNLGADRVIDYKKEAFDEVLQDIDLALDSISLDNVLRTQRIMRRGGRIVGITQDIKGSVSRHGPVLGFVRIGLTMAKLMLKPGVKTFFHTRYPSGAQLEEVVKLCEAGALRPNIDRVFALEEIVEATKYSESGHARGKIVLLPRPEQGNLATG